MIDYLTINAALYSRVETHADGAALRTLISGGSIFEAKDPINLAGKTLPYLMWRTGDAGGQSGVMRPIGGSWWAYVAPMDAGGTRTLMQIKAALETLYGYHNRHAISGGELAIVFNGRPFYDTALKLNGVEVRIQYTQRG